MDKGKIDSMIVEDLTEACSATAKMEATVLSDIVYNKTTTSEFKLCPTEYCTGNKDGECDLKLFVSWKGTDKDGTALISSGDRFMNFKNYNLAGMYESILKVSNRESEDVDEPYLPKNVDQKIMARVKDPPKVIAS